MTILIGIVIGLLIAGGLFWYWTRRLFWAAVDTASAIDSGDDDRWRGGDE